jgi:AAHS family 4-hydroxybenzoate transporter-like MFS transporter
MGFGAILAMLAIPAMFAAIAILLTPRTRAGAPIAQAEAAH